MRKVLISVLLAACCSSVSANPSISASSALVVDAETNTVLINQADTDVRPIASITKLMTALVVAESGINLDEVVTITQEDVTGTMLRGHILNSPLTVGTRLSRRELLQVSLMSSNNRAAHALARTFPGGKPVFVELMNHMAAIIGMENSVFVEPTGLDSSNVATASDLVKLVHTASKHEVIRAYSTTESARISASKHQYSTTNRLVRNHNWHIDVQKTGFINDAGGCLVMMATIATRKVIIVLLNAPGNNERAADANTIRKWLEHR